MYKIVQHSADEQGIKPKLIDFIPHRNSVRELLGKMLPLFPHCKMIFCSIKKFYQWHLK